MDKETTLLKDVHTGEVRKKETPRAVNTIERWAFAVLGKVGIWRKEVEFRVVATLPKSKKLKSTLGYKRNLCIKF